MKEMTGKSGALRAAAIQFALRQIDKSFRGKDLCSLQFANMALIHGFLKGAIWGEDRSAIDLELIAAQADLESLQYISKSAAYGSDRDLMSECFKIGFSSGSLYRPEA